MSVAELKKWVINNNIEERTISSFYKMLENYRTDFLEEYNQVFENVNVNELITKVEIISLNLKNWPECNEVSITSSLYFYSNDKNIGKYELVFSTDGEMIDDFVDFL